MSQTSVNLSDRAHEMRLVNRPAVAEYPPGAHLPRRVKTDFELVWMLGGRARVVTADAEIAIAPWQLLLIPPGVPHGFVWDPDGPSVHGYIHFQPELLAEPRPGALAVRPMTGDDPLAGLCAYLVWLGRGDDDHWHQPVVAALRLLLALFVDGPLPKATAGPEIAPALAAAIQHVRRAWSELPLRPIGADELADASGVSPGYLQRLFRAEFGGSLARALEQLRCARAEMLLTGTDLTADAIARQCGFADLSHFSHRFSAIHAMPPTAYRATVSRPPSVLDASGPRRLASMIWDGTH